MSFRRYEITLPTRYNDGSEIDPEKYLVTRRELAAKFGALTFLPEPAQGEWTHEQIRFEDVNLRIVVDAEDTPENTLFFTRFKETLKGRFKQLEIWIISFEIRII